MSSVVEYSKAAEIGVIAVNNPPVNALSQGVRAGLQESVRKGLSDEAVKAMVIVCEGRTFIAGADIREFGKPMADPGLVEVIREIEDSPKPVVAAIHGTALGGGLEVALACHYRCAVPSAKVGLPEVNLGLLPGAGGTQRLPRLVGADAALRMIAEGNHVPVTQAESMGLIDRILDTDDLRGAAVAYAQELLAGGKRPRKVSEMQVRLDNPNVFEEYEKSIARKKRGFLAPFHCIKAVKAATELPFDQGMRRERELFAELMDSPQSKAQRHVFFAEREVARVPGLPKDTPKREIRTAGIIGAGTMGGGIAMNFANAGIPVYVLEGSQEALDKGLAVVRRNYENTARKGRITRDDVEQRMALIKPTLSYDDLAEVDLVIEAVFEDMGIKKEVFGKLDRVCKQGAILATNTSTLDVNEIASATSRPQDVMGMHFFSPANVMRLLENVRGEKTADDVVATVMSISRRIGKVGVCVGVCDGFVGNRMLHKRGREANFLVEEGALPQQVDKVLYDFGMPMGPFAMSDLAGLDVGYRIRQAKRKEGHVEPRDSTWLDKIVEMGRYGQKTGAGVYRYEEGNRTPIPDPEIEKLIVEHSKGIGIERREVSDQEILERCMYTMVNEGAKILEEGIAARPLDIDIVWIYGYGFPVYRGGPMFWADQVGLDKIYDAILKYRDRLGAEYWTPAPLLERLAKEGKGFYDQ
ncbi:MAG TPA: 3-hydroxyacyl-CoA dehydrogenase NAD-binding domain-containing protein [Gammaproteobacteria bacterium]|nr:3-hydroxyacyl-CoA dehydrogenase NAD-binding domain-containing protein [Gammaproteobacteria bacterium]